MNNPYQPSQTDDQKTQTSTRWGFWIVAGWVGGGWVIIGFFVICALLSFVLPKQPSSARRQTLVSWPPPSIPEPTPTLESRLDRLNKWYASLSSKRQALDTADSNAIAVFNEEAHRYTVAVATFRTEWNEAQKQKSTARTGSFNDYPAQTWPGSGISVPALPYGSSVPTVGDHYVSGYTDATAPLSKDTTGPTRTASRGTTIQLGATSTLTPDGQEHATEHGLLIREA